MKMIITWNHTPLMPALGTCLIQVSVPGIHSPNTLRKDRRLKLGEELVDQPFQPEIELTDGGPLLCFSDYQIV